VRAAVPEGYRELLGDLKERIASAQIKATLSVNREPPEPDFWQQAAANLSWGHVKRLLDTVPDTSACLIRAGGR